MSSSNCCFLTCIQISQEADKVAWHSHLFKNFPQFGKQGIITHKIYWQIISKKPDIRKQGWQSLRSRLASVYSLEITSERAVERENPSSTQTAPWVEKIEVITQEIKAIEVHWQATRDKTQCTQDTQRTLMICRQPHTTTQSVKNPPAMQETPGQFLGQENLLQKG